MATEESKKLDKMNRTLGGKHFAIDSGNQVQIDQENARMIVYDGSANERARVGQMDDGSYGIASYKADGTVVFDETKIRLQYTFSNSMEAGNQSGAGTTGLVNYYESALVGGNFTSNLDFVKPTDFTIDSAILYAKSRAYVNNTGTEKYALDVDIMLNPTEAIVTGGSSGYKYYRVSGGDLLIESWDPTTAFETNSHTLTSGEIANISSGLNYVIAQSGTSSNTEYGYIAMVLVITGYLTY